MKEPWLTDPKYGGMSPASAKRSYEAWLEEGGVNRNPATAPRDPELFDQAAFDLLKKQIEIQLDEHEVAIHDFGQWMRDWRVRQPKGFKALRGAK